VTAPGLQPISGAGVLSRRGELVVLGSTDPANDAVVAAVLAAQQEIADRGGDGTAFADRLAELTAGSTLDVVVFGPAGGGVVVAVSGHAWADVTTVHGAQRLALRRSSAGVRTVLPGPLVSIRAGLGEVDVEAVPQRWADLQAGCVQAGGLLYVGPAGPAGPPESAADPAVASDEAAGPTTAELPTVPAPAAEPPAAPAVPPAPDVDRSQPFSSVVLVDAASGAAPQADERAPLPIAGPAPVAPEAAAAAHPVRDDGVQVLGVYCKNGHFDDPSARYCAICGISMAQLTLVPRPGPRPPLGVLVLDDGRIFSLDTDYVIGRHPFRDERVSAGLARPLQLDDRQGLISRAHTHIRLDGWQVQVVDLGSANGTGILGPGEPAWRPVPRLTPVPIRPGTQVGFGPRQLRYESHRNT
jgi:hypothetical protein